MAKTMPPGKIQTKGGSFVTNVLPDPFDERDLEYRPRLQPLPPTLDHRRNATVLTQKGSSCVGHAVAAMIDTILAHAGKATAKPVLVSPYMLYWLARRYDEFEGEEDSGSSLRGALKGWFYHGCALAKEWPALKTERDLEDPGFRDHCAERPLGAFYRINPYRLDDMQSAISELNVVVASAAIHDGWEEPKPLQKGKRTVYAILRSADPVACGGHAFALVGYNDVGFLVQNSWGTKWGKGGFATLLYEDWLDSVYDAWVARPGVPRTPFAAGRQTTVATSGKLVTGPGPDLQRLRVHVVNLGNQGRLSDKGKFVSTPDQLEEVFRHMRETHQGWAALEAGAPRRIVLYAHGALNTEAGGLRVAEKHLNWWLNNRVYPITFAWQTGAVESLVDQLADTVHSKLPAGAIGFDLTEQADRLVEKFARKSFRWLWDEIKENAHLASEPLAQGDTNPPGASLVAERLARYVKEVEDAQGTVTVHLVGHSAGGVFHGALLRRMAAIGLAVDTMSLLAPGLRVDDFKQDVLPQLGPGKALRRLGVFVLSDQRELDDSVSASKVRVYHKSLLYLASRALERNLEKDGFEVPLLGMERFFKADDRLRQDLAQAGGDVVVAPAATADDSSSAAVTHNDFDDDPVTMTSVLLRILDRTIASPENVYQPDTPLLPMGAPAVAASAAPKRPGRRKPAVESVRPPARGRARDRNVAPEVAAAPRSGSPALDVLLASGWKKAPGGAR